jgi:DNA-binding transcriptional ArsR family regulator
MRMIESPSLLDVLMPRTRQRILGATLLRPETAWYLGDLARHLHVRPSTLQRDLAALVEAGVLTSRRQGRMVYYQADRQCPIFPELQGLVAKTVGLVDVLRDALSPLSDRIAVAFVYGSVARGEETSASDVDLLLISGDVGLAEIAAPVQAAQERLGRDVNPRLYRPDDLATRLARGDHFLLNVLQKPKLFVIGDQRVLDELAEREPRRGGADE